MYKLAVAHEVLRQVDLQVLSPDDRLAIERADALEAEPGDLAVGEVISAGRALEHMLGDSSNAAAYALMRMVGPATAQRGAGGPGPAADQRASPGIGCRPTWAAAD